MCHHAQQLTTPNPILDQEKTRFGVETIRSGVGTTSCDVITTKFKAKATRYGGQRRGRGDLGKGCRVQDY